jgi:hypothetical protein
MALLDALDRSVEDLIEPLVPADTAGNRKNKAVGRGQGGAAGLAAVLRAVATSSRGPFQRRGREWYCTACELRPYRALRAGRPGLSPPGAGSGSRDAPSARRRTAATRPPFTASSPGRTLRQSDRRGPRLASRPSYQQKLFWDNNSG